MKEFILLTVLMFSMVSYADNCKTTVSDESVEETLQIKTDVPKFLEGATIIVRLKDGKETSVPAERFKVVARQQQYIVTKTKQSNTTMCVSEQPQRRHRVSGLIGQGRLKGLDVSKSANQISVEEQYGLLGGVQYQYMFTPRWSFGVQGQTNDTALGNLGYEF